MGNLRQPVYLEEKLKQVRESGRLNIRSKSLPTWCPGCGYFSIVDGVAMAINKLQINQKDVTVVITQAMAHRGFSYLHILSPCVTFDKTSKTYTNLKAQVCWLPEDHDSSNKMAAMRQAMDTDKPPLGLFYKESRPTLADNLDLIIESARGRGARASV